MIGISLGLSLWVISSRFGGLLEGAAPLGITLLTVASTLSFWAGAFLFFSGVWRMVDEKGEALIMASTGHIIVAFPAITLLVVDFLRAGQESFVNELVDAVDRGAFVPEFRLVVWIVFHVYVALFLALADHSGH